MPRLPLRVPDACSGPHTRSPRCADRPVLRRAAARRCRIASRAAGFPRWARKASAVSARSIWVGRTRPVRAPAQCRRPPGESSVAAANRPSCRSSSLRSSAASAEAVPGAVNSWALSVGHRRHGGIDRSVASCPSRGTSSDSCFAISSIDNLPRGRGGALRRASLLATRGHGLPRRSTPHPWSAIRSPSHRRCRSRASSRRDP